jgi:hypothetical protein
VLEVDAVGRQRFDQAEELVRDRVRHRTEDRERDQGRQHDAGRPVRAGALDPVDQRREQEREQQRQSDRNQDVGSEVQRGDDAGDHDERRSRSAVRMVGPGSCRRV